MGADAAACFKVLTAVGFGVCYSRDPDLKRGRARLRPRAGADFLGLQDELGVAEQTSDVAVVLVEGIVGEGGLFDDVVQQLAGR